MRLGYRILAIFVALLLGSVESWAGGPLYVTGPSTVTPGQIITWPQGVAIKYRLDGGPLSVNGSTIVVDATHAASRVQSMFQVWQAVPTANLNIQSAGQILSVPTQGTSPGFSDGDVNTAAEFSAVSRSCDNGDQNPIIYDADGSMFDSLGLPPQVIGFAGVCKISGSNIVSAMAALNGRFIDGVNTPPNYELPADGFDAAFIHEFGHFLGLDHSLINEQCLNGCTTDELAGLPTMFPILLTTEQKTLAQDDVSWISTLYPKAGTQSNYGKISGTIRFYDGISQAQDVNVIVQAVDDPTTGVNESYRTVVSVVSGYKFTGNPGQTVTGTNPGSVLGSHDPMLIGYYEVLVPAGKYTDRVQGIPQQYSGGSSVGPLDTPLYNPSQPEYWHTGQSNNDTNAPAEQITVAPGQTVSGIDFVLNDRYDRSDSNEDTISLLIYPDFGRPAVEPEGGAA